IMDYLCLQKPVAVSAMGAKALGHPFENIAYLTALFDGPMVAHIHVNWLAPVKVRTTLIGGTRKIVVYDDMEPTEKVKLYDTVTKPTREQIHERYSLGANAIPGMFAPILDRSEALSVMAREFVDAIKQKRLPISDGYAGY